MKKQVQVPVKVEKVVDVITETRSEMVEEVDGLLALLGSNVCFLCANYFYYGKLVGVNETCVKIADPKIVYETGEWSNSSWKDAQKLNVPACYVQTTAIEAFFEVNK